MPWCDGAGFYRVQVGRALQVFLPRQENVVHFYRPRTDLDRPLHAPRCEPPGRRRLVGCWAGRGCVHLNRHRARGGLGPPAGSASRRHGLDRVAASRDDDGRQGVEDLQAAVVATLMPKATADWFGARGVAIKIVAMGGALEGVCAAGLADAVVDLRETGTSLSQNRLRVVGIISDCQALFVHNRSNAWVLFRCGCRPPRTPASSATAAYTPAQLDDVVSLFPGLAYLTVVPLAGGDDLVAVHFRGRSGALLVSPGRDPGGGCHRDRIGHS